MLLVPLIIAYSFLVAHLAANTGIVNVRFKIETRNNHVFKQRRGNTHVCMWKNPKCLKRGMQKRGHKNKMCPLKKKLFQSMQIASRHVKYATMYLKCLQRKNSQKVFPEGSGP